MYICVNGDIIQFQNQTRSQCDFWECKPTDGVFITSWASYYLHNIENPETIEKDDIDFSKIKGNLLLSSRKQGDTFYIRRRGITKTLKKLFCEMKIPVENRNSIAVLHDGKNVVWVDGLGTDGRYAADKQATKIIRIKKEG